MTAMADEFSNIPDPEFQCFYGADPFAVVWPKGWGSRTKPLCLAAILERADAWANKPDASPHPVSSGPEQKAAPERQLSDSGFALF